MFYKEFGAMMVLFLKGGGEKMNVESEKILSKYAEKISTLGIELREFLLTNLAGITELPDAPDSVIGFGYGAGYKDLICTIIPSGKGVKLGFYRGAELPDPANLLTGTGKVHKYVEIKSAKDISNPALKNLLDDAVDAHRDRKA